MSRDQLNAVLGEIRALRAQILAELSDLTEDDFAIPVDHPRWNELRRVLLRFGEHMREHVTQIEGIRAETGLLPTMPQRILAQNERVWGDLLAATVGLTDDDLERKLPEGWSVMDTLRHVFDVEASYLNLIRDALAKASKE